MHFIFSHKNISKTAWDILKLQMCQRKETWTCVCPLHTQCKISLNFSKSHIKKIDESVMIPNNFNRQHQYLTVFYRIHKCSFFFFFFRNFGIYATAFWVTIKNRMILVLKFSSHSKKNECSGCDSKYTSLLGFSCINFNYNEP